MEPSRFLVPRRPEDVGNDLWRTFNVLQENLLRGGIRGARRPNRLTRTRRIRAIREDVRLNSALWEMAIARAPDARTFRGGDASASSPLFLPAWALEASVR